MVAHGSYIFIGLGQGPNVTNKKRSKILVEINHTRMSTGQCHANARRGHAFTTPKCIASTVHFLKSHGAEGAPLIREADQGGTLYDSRF
jgi:hypothetical protein